MIKRLALLGLGMLIALPVAVSAQETINLTVASSHPTVVPWVGFIKTHFMARTDEILAEKGNYKIEWNEAFGGTLYKRTAFAGATTGQQLLYSLDEQVRRWEVEGRVKKWEFWDFLEPVLDDDGRCIGAVCQDMVTMKFRAFPADAVILASGGCGLLYGRSTMSMISG